MTEIIRQTILILESDVFYGEKIVHLIVYGKVCIVMEILAAVVVVTV